MIMQFNSKLLLCFHAHFIYAYSHSCWVGLHFFLNNVFYYPARMRNWVSTPQKENKFWFTTGHMGPIPVCPGIGEDFRAIPIFYVLMFSLTTPRQIKFSQFPQPVPVCPQVCHVQRGKSILESDSRNRCRMPPRFLRETSFVRSNLWSTDQKVGHYFSDRVTHSISVSWSYVLVSLHLER